MAQVEPTAVKAVAIDMINHQTGTTAEDQHMEKECTSVRWDRLDVKLLLASSEVPFVMLELRKARFVGKGTSDLAPLHVEQHDLDMIALVDKLVGRVFGPG